MWKIHYLQILFLGKFMGFPPFFVCLLGPGRSMVQKRNIDIDGWLGPFGGTADIHYTGWLRKGFPDSWLKKKIYEG
jgi:hypothetical protein